MLYNYKNDEEKYVYKEDHPGHGYYSAGFLSSYVLNAKVLDDTYSIDVLFLRGNEMDGYDVNGIDVTNKVSAEPSDYEDKLIQYFNNHHEEFINGDKYRYVFEKDGSNYHLKSFSIVK